MKSSFILLLSILSNPTAFARDVYLDLGDSITISGTTVYCGGQSKPSTTYESCDCVDDNDHNVTLIAKFASGSKSYPGSWNYFSWSTHQPAVESCAAKLNELIASRDCP